MKRLLFAFFIFFLVDWVFFDGKIVVYRIVDAVEAGAAYLADFVLPYVS
jgi:hypothetical protein